MGDFGEGEVKLMVSMYRRGEGKKGMGTCYGAGNPDAAYVKY